MPARGGERLSGAKATSPRPSPWPVTAAAGLLVAAVWAALRLAPDVSDASTPPQPTSIEVAEIGTLDGFRSDAWYLPDGPLLGFVLISAGPFTMGSDPGVDRLAFDIEWWGDGRVQSTVDLPAFYLARYEVTIAQYAAFVADSGHPIVRPETLRGPATNPVAFVSWPDALAYTRWLDGALRSSASTPPALADLLAEGWQVRLPTEAEWEKAARGADARVYPWGEDPRPDRANYRARAPVPVGSFECSECPYPLSDMSGNIWEWTSSPYQPYPYTTADDREGLEAEALWVMRGGSFADPEQYVRAANRGGADPGVRQATIGFRVALARR